MKKIIEDKGFNIVDNPEEGGFATVYKAKNSSGVVRAFKTPKIASNASEEIRSKIKEDFKNECRNLMSLSVNGKFHPNIIKAYEAETGKEPLWVEMDYIEGMPFDKYAEEHFLKIEEVFHFIDNIGGALSYCHHHNDENGEEKCLIHNDLHSANIRFNRNNGEFILFDFGLSMYKGTRVRTSKRNVGWCEFMPPERCSLECDTNSPYKNAPATPAWDVYSFGCLIYLALTGQAPFSIKEFTDMQISLMHIEVEKTYRPWEHINELRKKHFEKIYPGIDYSEDCPSWLIDIIKKCMSREANNRFQNAQELLDTYSGFRKKQTVPYDDYVKLSKEFENLEKDRKLLQEDYNTLERKSSSLRNYINKTNKRNWAVSIIVVIALISNCLPYSGISDQIISSIGVPATIAISVLASIIIIGVVIFDSIVLNSKTK